MEGLKVGEVASQAGVNLQTIHCYERRGLTKRKIEVFSAGCPACEDAVQLINRIACPSCEVSILDMKDPAVAKRAKSLGIRSVPAVVVDGTLANCCSGAGPDEAELRASSIGQPI